MMYLYRNAEGNSVWKHVIKKVKVINKGDCQISGSFDCDELEDISGYINVTVLE
jgi:hypothetical protein